jgi:hypothetical protein
MIDEDEKFFKKNGVPLFSSHMIDLVCSCCSPCLAHATHPMLTTTLSVRYVTQEAWLLVHTRPRTHSPSPPEQRSHDDIEEPVDENINTCVEYLKRMAPMKQWLEMEIGITV